MSASTSSSEPAYSDPDSTAPDPSMPDPSPGELSDEAVAGSPTIEVEEEVVALELVDHDEPTGQPLRKRRGLSEHWTVLISTGIVVLLSVTMAVNENREEVRLPGMSAPLPEMCFYRRFLGRSCPGCGMTRSFISMGHGDLGNALEYNLVGPLVFLLVATQIPFRAIQLWRIRRNQPPLRFHRFGIWMLWIIVLLMVSGWVLRTVWS